MKLREPNEIKPTTPKHEGMRVLKMGYVPLKKIHSSNKRWTNVNRPNGPDPKKIALHEKYILDGKYCPEKYVPPTVVLIDGEYFLVTGAHRYIAHENTGETEFYCAIVEFYDTPNGKADYHKLIWQSNENHEDSDNTVAKNVRTDDGIISTTLKAMEDGYVSRDEAGIIRALTDQQIGKNTEKGKNLKNKILAVIDENADTVRIISKSDAAMIEKEESTPSIHAIVRTMKDASGIDLDYDMRLMTTILKFFRYPSKLFLNVWLHWTGLNAAQIREARVAKTGLFARIAEMCREYLEIYDSGELERRTNLLFTEQLKDDFVCYTETEIKKSA